jgi:hypothetical protein
MVTGPYNTGVSSWVFEEDWVPGMGINTFLVILQATMEERP